MQFKKLKNLTWRQLHDERLAAARMHAAPGNRVTEYRAAIERELNQQWRFIQPSRLQGKVLK